MTADSPTPIAPRVPLGRRLAVCFFFLFAALCTVTAIAWVALDRIQRESGRIAERYLPQYERVSQVQILMFRISLEARHAMLVTTPEEKAQTVARIQGFRSEMLQLLEDTERAISTDEGRQRFAAIREADRDFWRLGGEVLGKVQAGDVAAAFAQLNTDLVPARDRMVAAIALQREWQRTLATQAAQRAEFTATSVQIGLIALVLACGAFAAWLIWKLQRALRGALRRARDVTRRIAGGVEAGDEADDTPPDGDAFAALFASIAEMQQRLGEAVSRVHSTAANIARTAAELDQANLALQATTEQQSGTVAGTRDSAHRMADAVRESADHADNVSQLAGQASQVAVAGGEAVGRVVGQMQSIDESSRRIRDIVGVIDGIAFQTNILALNAAVEAARAGEQGRGFAVVASEVRSLAQRSAAAAREVKTLIEDSVERVAHGAEAATQAGQTMQSVVGQVDELSRLMNRIAETAGVQRAQAQAMGDAVGAMEGATQRNAAVVEQSRNAAAALRAHAEQLEAAVAVFGQARA